MCRYVNRKTRTKTAQQYDEGVEALPERDTLYAGAQMLFYYYTQRTQWTENGTANGLHAIVNWIKRNHGSDLKQVDDLLRSETRRRHQRHATKGVAGQKWFKKDRMEAGDQLGKEEEAEPDDHAGPKDEVEPGDQPKQYDQEWSVDTMSVKIAKFADASEILPLEFNKFLLELDQYHQRYEQHISSKVDVGVDGWGEEVPFNANVADPWWWLVTEGYNFESQRAARINFFHGVAVQRTGKKNVIIEIPDAVPHATLKDWYEQQKDDDGDYRYALQFLSLSTLEFDPLNVCAGTITTSG